MHGLPSPQLLVGQEPFAAEIYGEYSNIMRTVEAKLVDGELRLIKVIGVFLDGDFKGHVKRNGKFEGTWGAVETSNDLGIEGRRNSCCARRLL